MRLVSSRATGGGQIPRDPVWGLIAGAQFVDSGARIVTLWKMAASCRPVVEKRRTPRIQPGSVIILRSSSWFRHVVKSIAVSTVLLTPVGCSTAGSQVESSDTPTRPGATSYAGQRGLALAQSETRPDQTTGYQGLNRQRDHGSSLTKGSLTLTARPDGQRVKAG